MARRTVSGAEVFYAAAAQFVDRCLRAGTSLFTDGRRIWSKKAFNDLRQHFIDQPLEDKRSFLLKLRQQLTGLEDPSIQLMAELLFIHFLITVTVGARKKRETIQEVLSWMKQPATIPADLREALNHGLANPGTAYNTRRDWQITFLITFGERWISLSDDQRSQLLTDPWQFKEFAFALDVASAFSQRNALLHLVHPEMFDAITSQEHKKMIAARFHEYVYRPTEDVDRQLLQVREKLAPKYGTNLDFYSEGLEPLWRTTAGNWTEFINLARRLFADPNFDEYERTYKLRAYEQFTKARAKVLSGAKDWLDQVGKAFRNTDNNLTSWRVHEAFLEWAQSNSDAALAALEVIWADGPVDTGRIGRFLDRIPATAVSGPGGRLALAALLLATLEPLQYPPYRSTAFEKAYELTDYAAPPKKATEVELYDRAIAFLDQFIEEAGNQGLELRDRLDAQGLVWAITKWTEREPGGMPEPAAVTQPPAREGDLAQLADELLLDKRELETMTRLLMSKLQVVFYGPPGTGKTFVAQRLARQMAGPDGAVELVQFHPSYAYEDFVEGYRPSPDGSGFQLQPGPLKRFAQVARDNPGHYHVFVIDELNRGNVAKVFGELYFLLEYRHQGLNLQYSEERFFLPQNLLIIGTMNTADRSIALVDAALRRRFFFFPFFPDQAPIKGLLRRWLQQRKPELIWVADVVEEANKRLGDRNMAIGPSFFMRQDLDEPWVDVIWKHSILPYIEEQLYGQQDRLREFQLQALRGGGGSATTPP